MGKNFQGVTVTERNVLASLEAECNCVGLMLKDRNTIPTILGIASQDDFNYEANKRIINTIVYLYDQGKHIDYITVGDELGRRGELESIGGSVQLNNLHDLAVSAEKAEEYAKIVRDWSALRNVREACQNKISEINTGVVSNPIELIDGLTKNLHDAGSRLTTGGFVSVNEIHDEIHDNLDKARSSPGSNLGISTGIAHLDNITGGLQRGDYIVLGARTSVNFGRI